MKLWDVGAGTAVTTFNMGSDVSDQQLGCLWQKDHLLSISLSGFINYLDKNNPDRPIRTVKVRLLLWWMLLFFFDTDEDKNGKRAAFKL